jgi:adenylyltransferase/sulfurtransferase
MGQDRYYSRQILLSEVGKEGQQKLREGKCLVIGAGGLGSPALLYLASAGIGTLGVCDFDLVDESNLHRQPLYSSEDIGKPKQLLPSKNSKNSIPISNAMLILKDLPAKMPRSFSQPTTSSWIVQIISP